MLLAFTSTGSAENWSVGSSGNFTSIQTAIDNSSNGDTIYVASGEYIENIVVNKQVAIVSENGSSETSIIAADAGEHVVYVTAGNVTINGFNISGADEKSGIYLDSDNNTLINNQVSLNEYGIHLYSSQYNVLENNSMSDNTYNFGVEGYYGVRNDIDTSNTVDDKPIYYLTAVNGVTIDEDSNAGTIYCIGCKNITIKNVTLSNNLNGIYFQRTSDSKIDNIQAYDNKYGIAPWYYSNENVITNNIAENNEYGIAIRHNSEGNILNNNAVSSKGIFGIQIYSDNTILVSNSASDNNGHGIALASNNNTLISNVALNNRWNGIYLLSSFHNKLEENNATGNGINGLFLKSSETNTLTGNTFMENEDHGIYFNMSHSNKMKDNIVSGNVNFGLRLSNSSSNLIY
ncbi:MAG: NosD domain-containing protein, partial [Methanolobus sp.]